MMNYFIKTILFFFLLGAFKSVAQLDNPKGNNTKGKSVGILVVPTTVKEVKKPKTLNFDNDNGLKQANVELQKKRKQREKEQVQDNKGIITQQMIAKQNFKKNIEGNFKRFPMIDMDLGSFHTQSKNVYVSSYDFGRFDGDKVQIAINGRRIHSNYLLTPQVKTIKIPLDIGINRIEITAINEGELSPNTGYFIFFDDNKYIIKEGEWMLAKGAKVIAIVVRDEK